MKNIPFLKKRKDFNEITIYYLIVLLPISLVTGPLLPDLSISIITILFLYISIKKKLFDYYLNIFSKIFGIFFLILLLTSLFSLDPIVSFKKTIFYFRFWIFTLAVWHTIKTHKKLVKHLIISFSFIFIFLVFDGFIQFFFKTNILGWPIQGSRISSFFKDELILGSYLARLLPIYFGLLILNRNFDNNISNYILFFIIFVGIETLTFLSGERVAFFYINISALFLIISMNKFKFFRASTISISFILIFFLINLYPKSSDRMITKTFKQLGVSDEKKYVFSIEHQNHYTSAIRMFKDYKFTGVGPRMFRHACDKKKYNIWEGCSTHPHNTFVQLLAETGIIGFIFGLGVFLYSMYVTLRHIFFKYIYKKIVFNDSQLSLLSAILISIWPFVPTGGLFNNWLNIIYFFPVGLLLNSIYSKKN